jgi:hypothetical protein
VAGGSCQKKTTQPVQGLTAKWDRPTHEGGILAGGTLNGTLIPEEDGFGAETPRIRAATPKTLKGTTGVAVTKTSRGDGEG